MSINFKNVLLISGVGIVGFLFLLRLYIMQNSSESDHWSAGRCVYGPFELKINEHDCSRVRLGGGEVLTLGYDLDGSKLIRDGAVEGNKVTIRIRPRGNSLGRSFLNIEGMQPIKSEHGRSVYMVKGEKVVVFQGEDGGQVYVDTVIATYELDRIYRKKYEVLYQFDKSIDDFENVDKAVLELLDKIIVR
ncbi:hypothetical protein [Pseudomonas gingeri]|uniref:Uncharacterized protein n=4 Tax=Pseudomonas gingeri TaxID=117681 RepID=A0A7Y7YJ56_9PSED|nr:hypothetical protein [Pseudomonas gingeri]NWA02805.1 hypothetical protein [Pseudomonas gingeri]NWA18234.1 hypothetical protein [Pseudomonas gingeri]NWA58976.1 hypothetical protein [Pseudomonas gingeri]NWA99555.1 hypothetical protein [Pseudomonas gingeri]NWB05560.1 hypothetical protein [Pseudomonas gingeri]